MSRQTALIVDTNGLHARAFYAVEATPGVSPVIAALRSLFFGIRSLGTTPSHWLFCVDGQSKTDKKRPEKPPEFYNSLDRLVKALKMLFGPTIVCHLLNHEADDVIATAAFLARNLGHDVVIMTGDKDLQQLVDGHVSVYDLKKKHQITEQDVTDRWKIRSPSHLAIYLALVGDPIDGIDGVSKVGQKKAQKLLEGAPLPLSEAIGHVESQLDHHQVEAFYTSLNVTLLQNQLDLVTEPVPVQLPSPDELDFSDDPESGLLATEVWQEYRRAYFQYQLEVGDVEAGL